MSNKFRAWLSEELTRRGWSHNELGRRAGISQTAVSNVLSGNRNPGADFCVKIAQALDESPEKVLRLAGILPALPASENDTQEAIDIVKSLPPDRLKQALDFLRYLYRLKG